MTGDELRSWRARLGWTQPEAAVAIGLSMTSVREMECGRRGISLTIELACAYRELEAVAKIGRLTQC